MVVFQAFPCTLPLAKGFCFGLCALWCVLRAFPLAGGTCVTRETRGTFSSFEMPWQDPASIVSNTWLSALALHIVMWAVRFSANGSATLGINPCLAHCQFQKSIVPRVLRVAHVPLAACKSRSSAPCKALYFAHFKARSPCTGARMRLHWTGNTCTYTSAFTLAYS